MPRRDRHELWQLRRPPRQRRAGGGDSGEAGSPGPERVKRAPGASAACVSAAGPGTPARVLPGAAAAAPAALRAPESPGSPRRAQPAGAAEPRAPPQPEASAAAAGAGREPRTVAARRGGRAGGGAARVAFPGATSERSTPRRRAASPVARQQVWRRRSPRASGSGRISFLPASARPGRRGPSGTMPMDVILVVWFCVCTARTGKSGWGGQRGSGKAGTPLRCAQRPRQLRETCSRSPRWSRGGRRGRVPAPPLPCSWEVGLPGWEMPPRGAPFQGDAGARGAAGGAHPSAASSRWVETHRRAGPRAPHPRT